MHTHAHLCTLKLLLLQAFGWSYREMVLSPERSGCANTIFRLGKGQSTKQLCVANAVEGALGSNVVLAKVT